MIKSKNILYENKEQLIEALKPIKVRKPNKALVQVFCGVMSVELIESIIEIFNQYMPGTPLIGVTTAGEIMNGESREHSIVINITSFQKTEVKSVLIEDNSDLYAVGQELSLALKSDNTKAAIVFGCGMKDGRQLDGSKLMQSVQEYLPGVVVSGAEAIDNCKCETTYVFTEKGITNKGVVGASLSSGSLHVLRTFNLNWAPIGNKLTVTRVEGDNLYSIDGQSINEIYKHYLGEDVVDDFEMLSSDFPLMVSRNGIPQPIHVKKINKDGSFKLSHAIKNGEEVQFGYSHAVMLADGASNIYKVIEGQEMEVAFVYASSTRKKIPEGDIDVELAPLKALNCSVGFFGYGSYYQEHSGINMFLDDSLTVLTLSEGFSFDKNNPLTRKYKKVNNRQYTLVRALHNIIERSVCDKMSKNNK